MLRVASFAWAVKRWSNDADASQIFVAEQLTVSSGSSGLEGHDAAGSLCSGTGVKVPARVDVLSSVSDSVFAFASEFLDVSESHDCFSVPQCYACRRNGKPWKHNIQFFVKEGNRPGFNEGEGPSAANLNLYGESQSRLRWHSDDEPLLGASGDPKLIVSLSSGASALFRWKLCRPCSLCVEAGLMLSHGDLLVMDGYGSWIGET